MPLSLQVFESFDASCNLGCSSEVKELEVLAKQLGEFVSVPDLWAIKHTLDVCDGLRTGQGSFDVVLCFHVARTLHDMKFQVQRYLGVKGRVSELPAIEADPTRMRQLFQNLIGNALKFHKEGEAPVLKVHCSEHCEGSCEIIVEDNGIGFEEKYLERIFAPFQRLHGRSAYEGTGMGLAICKKIVERHGGSITARSEPGIGSRFIIELPSRKKSEPSAPMAHNVSASTGIGGE